MDIGFVFHAAEGFRRKRFNRAKQFIASVATILGINPPNSRGALLQYSNNAGPIVAFNKFTHLEKFLEDLSRLPKEKGKNRVALALRVASARMFNSQSRIAVSRVAVLVTFGKAIDEDGAEIAAMQLKAKGVKVFVVHVGSEEDMASFGKLASNADMFFHVNALNNLTDLVLPVDAKIVSESGNYAVIIRI